MRIRFIERAAVCVFLASLIGCAFFYMRPMLFRTWFFYADEYVIAAEVIRFSQLNFRQHFFDIPGTPFILINALIWRLLHGGNQMPLLFAVIRGTTLAFFLLSPVLLFLLCARLTSKVTAAVATLLLMLSADLLSLQFVRAHGVHGDRTDPVRRPLSESRTGAGWRRFRAAPGHSGLRDRGGNSGGRRRRSASAFHHRGSARTRVDVVVEQAGAEILVSALDPALELDCPPRAVGHIGVSPGICEDRSARVSSRGAPDLGGGDAVDRYLRGGSSALSPATYQCHGSYVSSAPVTSS